MQLHTKIHNNDNAQVLHKAKLNVKADILYAKRKKKENKIKTVIVGILDIK